MKIIFVFSFIFFITAIEAYYHRNIIIPNEKLYPTKSYTEWRSLAKNVNYIPRRIKPTGYIHQPEMAGEIRDFALPRIIGGAVASLEQIPWQVSIVMDSDYFCGGSLLSKKWILTAGHCIHDIKEFIVRVGSLSPFEGQSITTITRKLHRKYNPHSIKNDIGLIKVKPGFNLTDNIIPIKLPKSWLGDLVGEKARISGWGKTSDNSSLSNKLLFTDLTIVDNLVCLKTFGAFHHKQLCATGGNKNSACSGDSGSPLTIQDEDDGKWMQVGIVSFGSSFGCEKGYPLAFTRVSSYLPWISKKTHLRVH